MQRYSRFRNNGYEGNGDKKSFALAFDSVNSEHLSLSKSIAIGETVEFEFTIFGRNGQDRYLFSNSSGSFRGLIGTTDRISHAGASLVELYIEGVSVPKVARIEQLEQVERLRQ